MRSQAASTLRTRSTASSGPKISSWRTGESAGRSAATVGATNQPSPGSPSARSAAMRPAPRARSRVALDALLGLALDDRRDVGAEGRRPGRRRAPRRRRRGARAARRRSPRGRARARPPSTSGRRRRTPSDTIAGHDVVEVGVGVDDHAVLAAHLGDDALEVVLARARPRRRRGRSPGPTAPEPVKAIVCTRGSRDQRGARLALAGQQRERVGRARRPRAARRTTMSPQPGDCSAGLRTTALPVASAAAVMPVRDREREVPRRDHGDDAARARSASSLRSPGTWKSALAAVERDRAAGVVLEEVDRLADVGVGLGPRLARTRGPRARRARRRRSRSQAAAATRSAAARSAAGRRRPRRRTPRGGGLHRRVDLGVGGRGGEGDDAVGVAGSVETSSSPSRALVADPARGPRSGSCASSSASAVARAASRTDARRSSSDRLVGEGRQVGHGAASSSSSERPAACSCRKDSLVVFSSSRRTR